MPNPNIIAVNLNAFLSYEDVRKQIAEIIQDLSPNASVHDQWRTEFDTDNGLRKVTALLYGQNDHAGIIHSWQIGVSAAPVVRGETNDFELVGSDAEYNVLLNIDIWGFFDYAGLTGGWKVAEDEARLVQATINRNRSNLFRNHPKAHLFQHAYPFDINSIDIEPFADGTNVIIAQCLMQAEIRESLNA